VWFSSTTTTVNSNCFVHNLSCASPSPCAVSCHLRTQYFSAVLTQTHQRETTNIAIAIHDGHELTFASHHESPFILASPPPPWSRRCIIHQSSVRAAASSMAPFSSSSLWCFEERRRHHATPIQPRRQHHLVTLTPLQYFFHHLSHVPRHSQTPHLFLHLLPHPRRQVPLRWFLPQRNRIMEPIREEFIRLDIS